MRKRIAESTFFRTLVIESLHWPLNSGPGTPPFRELWRRESREPRPLGVFADSIFDAESTGAFGFYRRFFFFVSDRRINKNKNVGTAPPPARSVKFRLRGRFPAGRTRVLYNITRRSSRHPTDILLTLSLLFFSSFFSPAQRRDSTTGTLRTFPDTRTGVLFFLIYH